MFCRKAGESRAPRIKTTTLVALPHARLLFTSISHVAHPPVPTFLNVSNYFGGLRLFRTPPTILELLDYFGAFGTNTRGRQTFAASKHTGVYYAMRSFCLPECGYFCNIYYITLCYVFGISCARLFVVVGAKSSVCRGMYVCTICSRGGTSFLFMLFLSRATSRGHHLFGTMVDEAHCCVQGKLGLTVTNG